MNNCFFVICGHTHCRSETSERSGLRSRRSSKRASMPDLEEPPAKQPKDEASHSLDSSFDSDFFCFAIKQQAKTSSKSFYSGKQSRYLSPVERKRIAEIKESKARVIANAERKENTPKEKLQDEVASTRKKVRSGKASKEMPLVDKSQKRDCTKAVHRGSLQKKTSSKVVFEKRSSLESPAPDLLTPKSRGTKDLPSLITSNLVALAEGIGKTGNSNDRIVHTAESPGKPLRHSPRKTPRQPFVNPFSQDLFTRDTSVSETSGTPEFWRITINGKSNPQLHSQPRRKHSSDSGLCQSPLTSSTQSSTETESVLLLSEPSQSGSLQKSRDLTPVLFESEIQFENTTPQKSGSPESPIPGSPNTHSCK